MDEGKLFGGDIIAEPVSAAHSMEKLLFSTLMEGVWTTGIEFSYPVIVLPDEIPQDGTGCEGYSPVDVDIPGDGNVKLSVERTPEPWLEGFVCDNELGAGYCESQMCLSIVDTTDQYCRADGCALRLNSEAML